MQPRGEERAVTSGRQRRLGLGRRLIGWIAAYAFVLHAVLAGAVGVQIAANAAAPGFELCLAHADGTSAPAQDQHPHDQCALHCAAVLGFAALALALIAFVFPLRPIAYVRRRSAAPQLGFLCRAGLSRAPPLPA
jgi:hypothetical protein